MYLSASSAYSGIGGGAYAFAVKTGAAVQIFFPASHGNAVGYHRACLEMTFPLTASEPVAGNTCGFYVDGGCFLGSGFQLCVEKPGLYGDIVAGRDPGNSGGFH